MTQTRRSHDEHEILSGMLTTREAGWLREIARMVGKQRVTSKRILDCMTAWLLDGNWLAGSRSKHESWHESA